MNIVSFSPFGYEGALVHVDVDVRRGIPAVDMVGLADGAVKESRERMRSAIRNSGFEFPPERVLISLSPADLRKEGAGFDLAVALAVLQAQSCAQTDTVPSDEQVLVMGELELNGNVRPVRGIYAAVTTALEAGIHKCIIPHANKEEACGISGMQVFGADSLREAFKVLTDESCFSAQTEQQNQNDDLVQFAPYSSSEDYALIQGQEQLLRALQIAAAGGHNLLAFGPPGCGKTLALQRFYTLLPLLTSQEAQSVTRIHSIAGLLSPGTTLIRTPPFRQPHQSASLEGLCGGGSHCMPGEISLAHNGVLFLDEAAEFRSSVLQMMRVPLETGSITLSRAGRATTYPSRFQLLMATNPCPCGAFGSKDKLCLCSSHSIEQYWKKFSGPLLDRIDIRIHVQSKTESNSSYTVSTEQLRKPIASAVHRQRTRQHIRNAQLTIAQIEQFCTCTEGAKDALEKAAETYSFSARAKSSCLKLARTIADMEEKDTICTEHMTEAIDLRKTEGGLNWDFLEE
ncbi:MAG: YifB family Mg chelatase-like AAA ATPase [Treponema sp.]|nr:YifB family Mg chelatase-like AAA ATPase [Treponema sp.]